MPTKLSTDERKALFALSIICGGDWKLMNSLSKLHDGWEETWRQLKKDIKSMHSCHISDERRTILLKQIERFNHSDYENRLKKRGVRVVILGDQDYPLALSEIYYPPYVLYVRGNTELLNEQPFAVVGSRAVSLYGREAVAKLIPPLASVGLTIVSGLALGVDALAHKYCINAGGKTIAVLGSGIDVVFPRSNIRLADEILKNGGAIVSEYPLGISTMPHFYPVRNRIIAGLSQGVMVIEAKKRSGALITARLATENNRDVFAVPGGIFAPNSEGTNRLLQQGAYPVTEALDVIEALGFRGVPRPKNSPINLTSKERDVFDAIGKEAIEVCDLLERTGFETEDLMATLTIMQLKGVVEEKSNGVWSRAL